MNYCMYLLSKSETTSMRGVAIIFIILHNLLHWILPSVENEFDFSIERSFIFLERLMEYNYNLLAELKQCIFHSSDRSIIHFVQIL